MTTFDRIAIAQQFHRNVQVSRAEIFGANDPLPLHLHNDAHTMFAGYVGADYQQGGVVLLAINPGGGGDKYLYRTPEDQRLYPLLSAFKGASPDETLNRFESINNELAKVIRRWNLRKIIDPTLAAAGVSFSEVCYLSAVPYRTQENKTPSVGAKAAAWQKIIAPTLHLLQPKTIIALGMKAGDVLNRHYHGSAKTYHIERSNGDNSIKPAAQATLKEIHKDFGVQ